MDSFSIGSTPSLPYSTALRFLLHLLSPSPMPPPPHSLYPLPTPSHPLLPFLNSPLCEISICSGPESTAVSSGSTSWGKSARGLPIYASNHSEHSSHVLHQNKPSFFKLVTPRSWKPRSPSTAAPLRQLLYDSSSTAASYSSFSTAASLRQLLYGSSSKQ